MDERENRKQGVPIAHIRLPRIWPLLVAAGLLLGLWRQKRALRGVEQVSRGIGEVTTQRWREVDERTDQLVALTRTLARLTAVLLAITTLTLVFDAATPWFS